MDISILVIHNKATVFQKTNLHLSLLRSKLLSVLPFTFRIKFWVHNMAFNSSKSFPSVTVQHESCVSTQTPCSCQTSPVFALKSSLLLLPYSLKLSTYSPHASRTCPFEGSHLQGPSSFSVLHVALSCYVQTCIQMLSMLVHCAFIYLFTQHLLSIYHIPGFF